MSTPNLDHGLDAIGWLKEFAGMIPKGYIRPAVDRRPADGDLGTYSHPKSIDADYQKYTKLDPAKSVERRYSDRADELGTSVQKIKSGGILSVQPREYFVSRIRAENPNNRSDVGVLASKARKGVIKHEVLHSILQQRREGPPNTVAGMAREEILAHSRQFFGKKSPNRDRPLGERIKRAIRGTIRSTKLGVTRYNITKWFEREGYQSSLDEARNRTARHPTEAQKKAGNYRKGSLSFQGIPVTLENPRGSVRRGVDDDGTPWSNEMHADYGYIPRTKGKDGDQVDVFLGPSHRSQLVVAIDQHKGEKFDETKFILGCDTREQAEKLYLSHYPKGWKLGPVSTCTITQFKEWITTTHPRRMKEPFCGQRLKALTSRLKGMKQFQRLAPQTPQEERHELLKTGLLSTGLATGLALGGVGLRGSVGSAERVAIKRQVANKIAAARRNARMAGEERAVEGAKTAKVAAKVAAKDRYKAGNASFQNLAKNPNLTKGEKQTVKRVHGLWKQANPNKQFSADHGGRSGSQKLRDGAIGAGALAAGGGILHAGLKIGRAADEVSPTAKAIRAVLSQGEQAAGNLRKGWIGKVFRLSSRSRGVKRFALRSDEEGIPYTGRVNRDRFVKQIHESDLDRRDRNMDHAGWAGGLAGAVSSPKGSTLKQRLIRTGLGAGAGVGGVLAIRAITDKKRDIYGDRPRWAKRAEVLPTVAGAGIAGAIAAKKANLFARGDYVRKIMGARPNIAVVPESHYASVIRRDVEGYADAARIPIGASHRQVPVLRKLVAKHARYLKPAYDAARKDAVENFIKKTPPVVKSSQRLSPAIAAAGAGGALVGYVAGRKEKKEFATQDPEDGTRGAVRAGVSGAIGGGLALGGAALLHRGTSIRSALKAAGTGAALVAAWPVPERSSETKCSEPQIPPTRRLIPSAGLWAARLPGVSSARDPGSRFAAARRLAWPE